MQRVRSIEPLAIAHSVAVNEWGRGSDQLATGGANQCIIAVAHNSRSMEGILGHFTEFSPEIDYPNDLSAHDSFHAFTDTIPEIGPLESTELWFGGGSLYHPYPEGVIYVPAQKDRDYVRLVTGLMIGHLGILGGNVTFEWQDSGELDAMLECQTGILSTFWTPRHI